MFLMKTAELVEGYKILLIPALLSDLLLKYLDHIRYEMSTPC